VKKRYNRFLIELDRLSIKLMAQNKEKKGDFIIIKMTPIRRRSNFMLMKMMMMPTLMSK